MNEQKIIQGDCLEVMKTMPDKSFDLILTDPPYGINYQSAWRIDIERFDFIEGDKKVSTEWLDDAFRILKDNSVFYCFTRIDIYPTWKDAVEKAGFKIKSVIVWDKIIHSMGDLNEAYAPCYELIIFAVKGKTSFMNGRPKDIIRIIRVNPMKLVHPTEKPVSLIEVMINNSSKLNDTILDPFLGSGTTLVACKRLNRNGIGIEINPEYCKIAQERLNNIPQRLNIFTNK